MGVFAVDDALRAAAIDAAHELGLFEALAAPASIASPANAGRAAPPEAVRRSIASPANAGRAAPPEAVRRSIAQLAERIGARGTRRLAALVDALVALGALVRTDALVARGAIPPRSASPIARAGWGAIADVIRGDAPARIDAELGARYQRHLLVASAPAAREVAAFVAADRVLDLGGGAGAYARAVLERDARAAVTLVDAPEVVELARAELAGFGERVTFVAGDAREVARDAGPHAAALLANVLHLHAPAACAALCVAAAEAIEPGGAVVLVDLEATSVEGAMFSLNMAIYTDGGAVYPTAQLVAWLRAAGLVGIETRRLASAPEMVAVLGYRPRGSRAAFVAAAGQGEAAVAIERELAVVRAAPLRTFLAHALAAEGDTPLARDLRTHYTEVMPTAHRALHAAGASELLALRLDWTRVPRLSRAIDRLYALLHEADADATRALGAPTADAFRARSRSLDELYARTHYGGFMPLLYGSEADLAYVAERRTAEGWDAHAAIDRYLTAPILHELCHFAPERDALMPLHLDECVAGWLGVHVHPAFAYPDEGCDDALFASPWLAQVGQAIARAFGIGNVLRAHAGSAPWDAVVPKAFVDAAARLGWDDWSARRSLHLLADTMDPEPWIALAVRDGVPDDPAFDRAIVEDALRAMCLETRRVGGSFRTRTQLPAGAITVTRDGVTTARRGCDAVAPRYWLPPAVAARVPEDGVHVMLRSIDEIPAVAAALCAGAAEVR